MRTFLLAVLLIAFFQHIAASQDTGKVVTVTVPASENINNTFLHRLFFGKHYRNLWSTPVEMRLLNLSENGYSVIREGGSRETFNLRLTDSLGRQFVARSIKKELSKALPPHLQQTYEGKVMNDLMSANMPYGPLIVPPLADAAGIMHSSPQLFILENDTMKQNNFTDAEGRLIVMIEERPDKSWSKYPNFKYASHVVNTEQYLSGRLNSNSSQTNAEKFLSCRLLDILIGDWSRHEDQYRWAVLDSNNTNYYEAIPRDRDHAFYKFNDGLFNKISLLFIPKTVTFSKNIGSVKHLNEVGEMLGKIILTEISRERWNEIVDHFQDAITDSVIKESVSRLPGEIYATCGDKLVSDLQSRRNQMTGAGAKLYKLIFRNADIIATNSDEIIKINRISKKETLIQIYASDSGSAGRLIYKRVFYGDETKSINIFALEGNDVIELSGVKCGTPLNIDAGPGSDVFIPSGKNKKVTYRDSKDYFFSHSYIRMQSH